MTDHSEESLQNKTIVITGASSGFGRGASLKLASLGANIVLAARREALLDDLATEIRTFGGRALPVPMDVSDPDAVSSLAQAAIEQFGAIDIWINNVGVGALGLFWKIPIEDQARTVDVNLKGLIYGAHTALRHFTARGRGTLVNIGSVDSEVPMAYQTTYAATKAAVLSISRSLNEELRLSGLDKTIKVATIMPWAVDTPWWIHAANYTGYAPRMAAMDDPDVVINTFVRACIDPQEEMPAGMKARMANASYNLFPDFTEHVSANTIDREIKKAAPAPVTKGSLFEPIPEGTGIRGGIRERMKQEDRAA